MMLESDYCKEYYRFLFDLAEAGAKREQGRYDLLQKQWKHHKRTCSVCKAHAAAIKAITYRRVEE
jgi:hypothetical protein